MSRDRGRADRRRRPRLGEGADFPGSAYFDRWGDDEDGREAGLTRPRRGPSRRVSVRVPLWWRLTRWLR